jgi:hypothetical protein
LERETGIEPVTSSLGSWRSTAELLPQTYANKDIYDVDIFTGQRKLSTWGESRANR